MKTLTKIVGTGIVMAGLGMYCSNVAAASENVEETTNTLVDISLGHDGKYNYFGALVTGSVLLSVIGSIVYYCGRKR